MIKKAITLAVIVPLAIGCNLNAPEDEEQRNGDSETVFTNVSDSHLPSGLTDDTTNKAKADIIINDGLPDIVLAVENGPNKLLINEGNGFFEISVFGDQSDGTADTRDVETADFISGGDAPVDLLFVNNDPPGSTLLINDGDGNFTDMSIRLPESGMSGAVVAFDADNDNSNDILIGNDGQNFLFINNGNAFFSNQSSERLPQQQEETTDFAIGDINQDSLPDIVEANETGNRILINGGSGFFTDETEQRLPLQDAVEETNSIALGDLNDDGFPDLYFANTGFEDEGNAQDRLLIHDRQGALRDETTDRMPDLSFNSSDVEFVDLNDNGDPDILLSSYDEGLRVLVNDGNGYFSDATEEWIPEDFTPEIMDVEVADLNQDNLPDIYISVRDGRDQLLIQQ